MSRRGSYGSMTVCKRESIGSLNTIIVNKPPKWAFARRTLAAFRPSRVKSVFGLFDHHPPVSAQDIKPQDGLTDNIGDMKVSFRYESPPPHVSFENSRPPMSRRKSLRSVKSMVARSLRSRRSSISPSKEEEVPKPISMSIRAKLAHRSAKTSALPVVGTPASNQGHTHEKPQYTRGINELEEMFRHGQQQSMAHDRFDISSRPFWLPKPPPLSARERSISPSADRAHLESGNVSDPFYHRQDEVTGGNNKLFCERVPRPVFETQKSADTIDNEAATNLHNRKRARTVVGPRPTHLSEEGDPKHIEIATSRLTHSHPDTIDHARTSGVITGADQGKALTSVQIEDSCFGSIREPVVDNPQNSGFITDLDQAVSQDSTCTKTTRKRGDSGYESLRPKSNFDEGERSLGLAEHQHITSFLGEPASSSIRCVSPDKTAPSLRSTTTSPNKSVLDPLTTFRLLAENPLNIETANAQRLRGNDTLKEIHGERSVPSVATAPICPPHALEDRLGTAPYYSPSHDTVRPQTLPLVEQENQEMKTAVTTANGILTVKWTRRADGSYEESGSSRIVSWSRPIPATENRTPSGTSSGLWQGSPSYSGRAWKRSDDSWGSETTVDVRVDDGCDGDMGFEPAFGKFAQGQEA